MANWNLQKGFDVYDRNDDKIGSIGEVSGDFFKVDTGFLGLGKDYFIPFSAITGVRNERVYVNTTKDRLDSMGWEGRARHTTTTTGTDVPGGPIGKGPEAPLAGFDEPLNRGERTNLSAGRTGPGYVPTEETLERNYQEDSRRGEPSYSEKFTRGSGGSSGSQRWEDVSSRYQTRWQSRFGTRPGAKWEDYEPSYRYGWEMRNRPEYRGRRWNEVEGDFRSDWQKRYSDKPWDRASSSLRDAWEDLTNDDDADYRGSETSRREDEALGDTRTRGDSEGRYGTSAGLTDEERRRRERGSL